VARAMLTNHSVIGGEGNGGVMLPDIHIGRDAPVAATLALQMLAIHGGTLSSLKASLPQWEIVKLKVPPNSQPLVEVACSFVFVLVIHQTPIEGIDADAVIAKIIEEWKAKGAKINTSDGVRIDSDDFWVHLRKSNTEPIVRVIGEASTVERATTVCEQFMKQIKGGV